MIAALRQVKSLLRDHEHEQEPVSRAALEIANALGRNG
jgi:hypothetical protein